MSSDSQPEYIPTNPQDYLSLREFVLRSEGQVISVVTHAFLLYLLSEAVASADPQPTRELYCTEILDRVRTGLEVLLLELSVVNEEALRHDVRQFAQMLEVWQRHFQERPDRMNDTD